MTVLFLVLLTSLSTPLPLLDAEDSIARGATAMYTISLEEGLEYWVLLNFDEGMDLDIPVAEKKGECLLCRRSRP